MARVEILASVFLAAVALTGCDPAPRWTSGKYEVYSIESSNDLKLGVDVGGGTQGLVMPQVIAVGEDSRWIVVARHPSGDKNVTLYYYFSKITDDPSNHGGEVVEGPLTEAQFKQRTSDHGLPPLTVYF